jgi:hypothetical protein
MSSSGVAARGGRPRSIAKNTKRLRNAMKTNREAWVRLNTAELNKHRAEVVWRACDRARAIGKSNPVRIRIEIRIVWSS